MQTHWGYLPGKGNLDQMLVTSNSPSLVNRYDSCKRQPKLDADGGQGTNHALISIVNATGRKSRQNICVRDTDQTSFGKNTSVVGLSFEGIYERAVRAYSSIAGLRPRKGDQTDGL